MQALIIGDIGEIIQLPGAVEGVSMNGENKDGKGNSGKNLFTACALRISDRVVW